MLLTTCPLHLGSLHLIRERVRTFSRRDMIKLGHSEILLGKMLLFSLSQELFCPLKNMIQTDMRLLLVTSRSRAALSSEILHMGVTVRFVCSLWVM